MNLILRTYSRSFSPLKDRNFRIYLSGQAFSLIGTWMQATAQAWVVWELTKSESALGLTVMFNTLPLFLLAPWAGTIADRYNRRKLLIATQGVAMTLAFVLAALVKFDSIQVWHIYLLTLMLGIVNALDFPAQQAFIGDLSGMSQIRRAITLNVMMIQVARLLGPMIAGYVLSTSGAAMAFGVNGLSFLIVIVSLLLVRSEQVRNEGKSSGQFMETLKYVASRPRMLDLVLISGIVTFFGFAIIINILPSVADHVLHGDAKTYSWLLAASGAGALVSTLILLPLSQASKRIGLIISGAALWMGVWFLVLGSSYWLTLSMIAIFFSSLGAPLVLTTGLGVIQLLAPANMRGRIVSLFTMVSFGLQPLASLFIGFSAEKIGTQTAILINSTSLLVIAGLLMLLRRGLLTWELIPQGEEAPVKKVIPVGQD
jgi:MFS family permease